MKNVIYLIFMEQVSPMNDSNLLRRKMLTMAMVGACGGVAATLGFHRSSASATPAENTPTEPQKYSIGIWTRCWDALPWRAAFDEAVVTGFTNVGLMTHDHWKPVMTYDMPFEKAEELRNEGVQRGLRFPAAYCASFGLDPAKFETGVVGLRRMIDLCTTAGVGMILLGGTGDEALQSPYYQTIAECCDYAQEHGVLLTIKPHGGLNATSKQCRKQLELVSHPAFRLCYDPGNIFYYSEGQLNPVDDVKEAIGLVDAVCVKDFLPPKNVDVTPGTGQVDFSTILKTLKAGGWNSGDLLIETLTPSASAEELRKQAVQARVFLEKLLPTI